jgi:sigma-E factor negative regulatory protein RseA
MDDLNSISNGERVSALMDGELSEGDCARMLDTMAADRQSIETWHVYQVVGDVMRSSELAPKRGEMEFLERLEKRLQQEPRNSLRISIGQLTSVVDGAQVARVDSGMPSANVSVFRWKMLAGVACSALLAVVGSGLWSQAELGRGDEISNVKPALTAAPMVVAGESPEGLMLRDPRLDELMAAHRQLGGHSALQVPAGFLRNATYEGVGR